MATFTNTETSHWVTGTGIPLAATYSLVVTKPSSAAADGALVMYLAAFNNGTGGNLEFTPPSGWTQRAFLRQGTTASQEFVFTKPLGGSEPSTYTFEKVNNGVDLASFVYGCLYVADVDADVIDATVTTSSGVSVSPIAPAITTVTDGAIVFNLVSTANGSNLTSVDGSYVSSGTDIYARRHSATSWHQIGAAGFFTQTTAGATSAVTFTSLTTSSQPWTTATIALRPATASGPVITTGTIVNATTEGFQVRFTTDTDNGTAYYVVFPTSASDPTAEQIVAGLNGDAGAALASGNQAVSATGVQTFSAVTGLDADTTYRVAVVHYGTPA